MNANDLFNNWLAHKGWIFSERPPIGELVLIGTGDCSEFLTEQGYWDGKVWTVQNYPSGRVPLYETALCWKPVESTDEFSKIALHWSIGRYMETEGFFNVLGYYKRLK